MSIIFLKGRCDSYLHINHLGFLLVYKPETLVEGELLFWNQMQHILEDKSREERKTINFRIISVCYNSFLYYFLHYLQEKNGSESRKEYSFKYFELIFIYLVSFTEP